MILFFAILMVAVFGKLFIFALKASWGIMKFLLFIIFLPLILIGFVIAGLMSLALPVLLVVGLFSLFIPRPR